jgi:hypothetical protein
MDFINQKEHTVISKPSSKIIPPPFFVCDPTLEIKPWERNN